MAELVRPAEPADADRLFQLVRELGHALTPEREAFDRTLASYFSGEQPSVLLLVAEVGGEVVGYALTTIVPLLGTNGPAAQIQEIVVSASARGGGVASQLVHAVEAECAARGVRQITVAARRAGGFYDRLGYHENAEYMRRFL